MTQVARVVHPVAHVRLHEEVERAIDRAGRVPVERLGDRAGQLFDLIAPMAKAIVEGGGYPSNPDRLFER